MTEHGPFQTEADANHTEAVRAADAAFDADPGAGKHIPHHLRILTDACEAAGVDLGTFDERVLAWLANWEASTCAVIGGIIRRAAQPPEGTVTEWGVRQTFPSGQAQDYTYGSSEQAARDDAKAEPDCTAVSRQVGPWRDVPETEPGEDEDHGEQ